MPALGVAALINQREPSGIASSIRPYPHLGLASKYCSRIGAKNWYCKLAKGNSCALDITVCGLPRSAAMLVSQVPTMACPKTVLPFCLATVIRPERLTRSPSASDSSKPIAACTCQSISSTCMYLRANSTTKGAYTERPVTTVSNRGCVLPVTG